ncbi:sugar ABC transporter substrate-binding protein [Amaricoccus solimangrovi]|uniref:Sugar ABC transporter substrate-binding protein n=1 Tax=Amaricoccus solimangrovi TaxID=2589815 RepID=A0A501WYC3_9RHOB|nr:sugar ABC transporter substrate-binding protein [Amaricoccus solimangrovi]TPE52021.1 sugar ABC transporter substrate-binding protein [Amaricoccus solimangrovi]
MSLGFDRLLAAAAVAAALAGPASAQEIGVAVSNFDDNFLTLLREAMASRAEEKGASLQFEDAQRDVGRQLSQIENFTASGLAGLIVAPVDSDSTPAMTAAASNAGLPLVYVNNLPANLDSLPDNEAFVGSKEIEAGQIQGKQVCELLKAAGKSEANILIMLGDLSNQATRLRTQGVKDVLATPDCAFIKVADEQTATWQRTQAVDLMTNWLSSGIEFDAVVANNDEMALGAVQAMKSSGVAMDQVIVAGVDATPDALASIAAGDLDFTVYQSAPGQGAGSVDAILDLIAGKDVPREVYVPFELVTAENYKDYMPK